MITKEQLESAEATCSRCGNILKLDHSGCPACYNCRKELDLNSYVELMMEGPNESAEIWVIDPRKYDGSQTEKPKKPNPDMLMSFEKSKKYLKVET